MNKLANEIHRTAKAKGWWDQPRTPLEIHALIHSEIAEATEAYRNNEPLFHIVDGAPEGGAVELVDAIIRILDYLAYANVDIDSILQAKMDYNNNRSYRHGGKKA